MIEFDSIELPLIEQEFLFGSSVDDLDIQYQLQYLYAVDSLSVQAVDLLMIEVKMHDDDHYSKSRTIYLSIKPTSMKFLLVSLVFY